MNLTSTASEEFNPAVLMQRLRDLGCDHELGAMTFTTVDDPTETLRVRHEECHYDFEYGTTRNLRELELAVVHAILNGDSHYWSRVYPHEVIEALHGSDT